VAVAAGEELTVNYSDGTGLLMPTVERRAMLSDKWAGLG
jgi:hypothetical protein